MYEHMCRGQQSASGVVSKGPPALISEADFLTGLECNKQLGWLASELQDLLSLLPQSWDDKDGPPCLVLAGVFLNFFNILFIYLCVIIIIVCWVGGLVLKVIVYTPEVKGQLAGDTSLFVPCGSTDQTQVINLGGRCPYPLSYLGSLFWVPSNT